MIKNENRIDLVDLYAMFSHFKKAHEEAKQEFDKTKKTVDDLALGIIEQETGISKGSIVKDTKGSIWRIHELLPVIGMSYRYGYPDLEKRGIGFKIRGHRWRGSNWKWTPLIKDMIDSPFTVISEEELR